MRKRLVLKPLPMAIILSLTFLPGGCAALIPRLSSPLVPHMMHAFFSECDTEIARQAMPSNLKLLEGLLGPDPENGETLKALCAGYAGYALLFLEDEEPDRAADLYLRARDYGLRSLGEKGTLLREAASQAASVEVLKKMGPDKAETLFWTSVAWSGWISMRGDNPMATAQLGVLRACIDKVLELDPDMFHGLAQALSSTVLSALPPILGGDPEAAKMGFERAVKISDGKFLFSKYLFARHGAVRIQDRKLFESLLADIDNASPSDLPGACLLNRAAQKKAERLRGKADELFY